MRNLQQDADMDQSLRAGLCLPGAGILPVQEGEVGVPEHVCSPWGPQPSPAPFSRPSGLLNQEWLQPLSLAKPGPLALFSR